MNLHTMLGIEWPLIQAPMAGAQDSALAIAVSNAGGLGSLPCAMLAHPSLREELQRLSTGTGRPYNVNFFCHAEPPPDPAAESHWRHVLQLYYTQFGIDPQTIKSGAGRIPFDAAAADTLAAFRPAVVSFHFGLPSADLLARMRGWGAKILSSATTVEEARWLEAHGVDAVIAQGAEAGGHRGMFLTEDLNSQSGTFALLPQVVRAVNVPVIAAGGIADARGVAAAMALGAAGVQVGTAYLLCPEARTSALHRAALKRATGADTAITNLYTGRPARGIQTRLMRELGPIHPAVPRFPRATAALAPLRTAAEQQGDDGFSPLWSGQNASGCREVPAAQLTMDLAAGFAVATPSA